MKVKPPRQIANLAGRFGLGKASTKTWNMEFFKISEPDFWHKISARFGDKGGVYKLVAMKNGQPVPVGRFLGTDREGVLYLGKATSFLDRVIALKKSISPEYQSASHECGVRYKANLGIGKIFPFEDLEIGLEAHEHPRELEKTMIENYVERFGEVPPLNAIR